MGYGYAAYELIEAIQASGVGVWWNNTKPYAHISFIQPEMYTGTSKQYRIGYTPWESTEIPELWVQKMNAMDEIWTTSNFCKDIFEQNGVKVDLVLPHGINSDVYPIVHRELNDTFYFLHIGGPTERKGGQMVMDAFVELFDGQDNVKLIMKVNDHSEARWRDRNGVYRGSPESHSQVIFIKDELTLEQMSALYAKAHCCVYPSNGEGFGLIPFQAIATGCPTILTNATGMKDFANLGIPLNVNKWIDGEGIHLGKWALPDFDHLKTLMSSVVKYWPGYQRQANHSARIIHSTQTWGHIAQKLENHLGEKLEMQAEGSNEVMDWMVQYMKNSGTVNEG